MITDKNWKRIKSAYTKLQSEKTRLQSEIAKLEKQGVINGSISYKWRKNKAGVRVGYARLLTAGGGNSYIGLNSDLLSKTGSAILRYRDCVLLRAELRRVDESIKEFEQGFQYFLNSVCFD